MFFADTLKLYQIKVVDLLQHFHFLSCFSTHVLDSKDLLAKNPAIHGTLYSILIAKFSRGFLYVTELETF